MGLVTDTWGANRNPSPKPFTMYKTLSVTAASGSAKTDTQNFFSKNCPFPVKITSFEVQCVSVSGAGFSGSGSAMTVALQRDTNVDASPTAPVTATFSNTICTVNCSGIASSTDKSLFKAPSNAGDRVDVGLDQTYVAVPKGGSLRATLSAQANDAIGVSGSTPVELLAVIECVPTATWDQIYF
ncbi:hypothetical protein LCGC14_0141530 [marine sediment metagenome]|uniref:Uncharacterized protein n=1 Tax=marine sediment metagenome TaxID=412755 RepID=A0A0F9Y2N6_9ZZZZ